jgi:hypothetical protein
MNSRGDCSILFARLDTAAKGAVVDDDEGLGAGFWWKMVGLVVLGGIAAVLFFLFISEAWVRWGGLGVILLTFLIIGALSYFHDRRVQHEYDELTD